MAPGALAGERNDLPGSERHKSAGLMQCPADGADAQGHAMVKARGWDSCPGLSHHRASNLLVFIESWSPSGQPVPTAVMEGKQNGRNQDAMLAELMACGGEGKRVEPTDRWLSGGG